MWSLFFWANGICWYPLGAIGYLLDRNQWICEARHPNVRHLKISGRVNFYQLFGLVISVFGIASGKRLCSKAHCRIGMKKLAYFFSCHEGLRLGAPGVTRPITFLCCSFTNCKAVAKSESFQTITAQS